MKMGVFFNMHTRVQNKSRDLILPYETFANWSVGVRNIFSIVRNRAGYKTFLGVQNICAFSSPEYEAFIYFSNGGTKHF